MPVSIIGENYHISGLRNALKRLSRQCSICKRAYARPTHQQMGLLPSARTTPSHVFKHTGIDFAGPFLIDQSCSNPMPASLCAFLQEQFTWSFVLISRLTSSLLPSRDSVHVEELQPMSTPIMARTLLEPGTRSRSSIAFTLRSRSPSHHTSALKLP